MSDLRSHGPINVRFHPDYRETNPYQDLLYRSLGPGIRAETVADSELLAGEIMPGDDRAVLHLHWETAIFTKGEISAEGFLDILSGFRDKGGRIVWSMHNLVPHDRRYREVAEQVRAGLLGLADIIHLHSLPALAAASDQHAMPTEKVRVIAHGNYDGVYPVLPRAASRQELGLDGARRVVLLPGQIRAYKAPGDLIEAFLQVSRQDDRLLLCGHRAKDVDDMVVPDDPRLVTRFGFSSAHDLARAHAAADFVVLPYRRSLTSGSAILAMTLGRAVLGSDTAGLQDAVDGPSTGVLYDPGPPDALAGALEAALGVPAEVWEARGIAAARAAGVRGWDTIGATWAGLFGELATLPRIPRVGL